MAGRLDVRLDAVHQRRLQELAQGRGVTVSDEVRRLIDEEHERAVAGLRRRALETIISAHVEDLPDPETLSRELDEGYDPGLP